MPPNKVILAIIGIDDSLSKIWTLLSKLDMVVENPRCPRNESKLLNLGEAPNKLWKKEKEINEFRKCVHTGYFCHANNISEKRGKVRERGGKFA